MYLFQKAPEPIEPWRPDILDALNYGNTCIRPNRIFLLSDDLPQSEDCLFLNIFVPGIAYFEKIYIYQVKY